MGLLGQWTGDRGEGTSSECGAWCDVEGGEGVSQDWVM